MGFIEQIAPIVQKYAPQYDIKVCSPILAQSILESQSGKSELATKANNYFGIKYRAGRCPSGNGIYYKVGSEQNKDGSYVSSSMQWQKFPNMDACVKGYFDFINVPNYKNLKGITDPKKYLETIKADGYATSLKYVDNLMAVIKKYNLTKYDDLSNIKVEEEHNNIYVVQVGSYSMQVNSAAMALRLKRAGFDCIVKQYGNQYKCQVGAFSKRENAEELQKKLKQKGFDCFIVYKIK